jgi:Phosphotransferase enzyme family
MDRRGHHASGVIVRPKGVPPPRLSLARLTFQYGDRVEINDETVLRVARLVIGDPRAELRGWSGRAIGGGVTGEVGAAGGVQRISGVALSNDREVAWSVILKILHQSRIQLDADTEVQTSDPRGWAYWHREADVYRSGLLGDLDGLVAPRCFSVDEINGEVAMWFEDLPDQGPPTWALEQYGLAARNLGRFNGSYLTRRPLPSHPLLSSGRVTEWTDLAGSGIRAMRSGRPDGLASAWLSERSVTRIERLWSARSTLIGTLEALPVTLCHHDAGRRNLAVRLVDGVESTVAIDWQIAGIGHLGEEPAALFAVSLQMLDVSSVDIRAFEEIVLDGYIEGLRDAGWDGDPAAVRLGFAIAASLMIGVGGAGLWFLMVSPDGGALAERIIGRPGEDITAQWSQLQPYLLDLGEEALATILRGTP